MKTNQFVFKKWRKNSSGIVEVCQFADKEYSLSVYMDHLLKNE